MASGSGAPGRGRARLAFALLACAAVALAVRAIQAPFVFPGDGRVQLSVYDAAYHARRALYGVANFPAVLDFDSYMGWPDGAPVPWPPGYDFALAGVARLLGGSEGAFTRVAAWSSPVLAALTVWPVHAIGAHLGGPGVGLAAAAIYAVLPASSLASRVGDPDHHALVALLAAAWLASSLAETRANRTRRGLRGAGHTALVAAMLLSWNGSLLYLLLGEGTRLFVAGVVAGSVDRLRAQARGALAAALVVAPVVALSGVPSGGWFSSLSLSWLHVLVLCALAVLAELLATLEARRPEPRALRRGLRMAALGGLVAAACLAAPPLRDALRLGVGFLGETEAWAVVEQRPLFDPDPESLPHRPAERFGWFAYLLPLTPLLVGARVRSTPAQSLVLFGIWSSVLAMLAIQQVRFGNDLAAPAAVLCAWTLAGVAQAVTARLGRRRFAGGLAVVSGALLLWPALEGVHLPALRGARAEWVRRDAAPGEALSSTESLWRFTELVRAATPETSGFLDASGRPEYGVLVDASLGHALVWGARRPVPANNFGPYLESAKLREVREFFATPDEEVAVEIARRLGTPFVVSADHAWVKRGTLVHRLHRLNGSAGEGGEHLGRFRLVTEGPRGARPLVVLFPRGRPRGLVPYKLFEVVEGARLEVRGAPGDRVLAHVDVATPIGRLFVFRAEATVGASGVAVLRLPYANEAHHPAHTVGPWRIASGEREWTLQVSEAAVRQGATLHVP